MSSRMCWCVLCGIRFIRCVLRDKGIKEERDDGKRGSGGKRCRPTGEGGVIIIGTILLLISSLLFFVLLLIVIDCY